MHGDTMDLFHPLIRDWFEEQIGDPTDIQAKAWPHIANGEHVLITAPTGSGKTLTAFLWALNQLVAEELPTGVTSVIYVSPLKALNNDIRRNLMRPLRELEEYFVAADVPFPEIRVMTRSGDTPQSDRRRMQRHPPEILITTPESLNLLLSSAGGRSMLSEVSALLLDEIHSVVGSKRGTHLITAAERLVRESGEFQRIALSATVRPMDVVGEFVGGFTMAGAGADAQYTPRPVTTIRSDASKSYDVRVSFPEAANEDRERDDFWEPLVDEFRTIISRNRSTLLFTNSRRLCEKITLFINELEDEPVAYSHHGSLSREIREEVERKLKDGELKGIVATSSLEMGIDIGALDEVVLIQSPSSISSAIQRVGRAGHQVGEVSRAALFPTHARDFIHAAVLAAAIEDQDIEEVRPVRCPLDVLAQIVVSMVGAEQWDIDDLYAFLRGTYPYHALPRDAFDGVLNMLAGRYADTRVRELQPRISLDRLDNVATVRKGAMQTLYASGGTIPDRGYFHMRHHESNARIGDLDEEFVWEQEEGTTFTLGAQSWRIERVTHNDVFVSSVPTVSRAMPFWKGEAYNRDFHFSERIGLFLEEATSRLGDASYAAELQSRHAMNGAAADSLVDFLTRQKQVTKRELPHRHHVLIEYCDTGPDGAPATQIVITTLWGGRLNRPYAQALAAAWEAQYDEALEVYAEDDCVVLLASFEIEAEALIGLVRSSELESLLRKRLESSGFFGARFRECAGRALLVTRNRMGQRMPLWLSRLRAKKLLESVMGYDDFPILLEAWRTSLQDEFDMDGLRKVLEELESGVIQWSAAKLQRMSPFAQTIGWWQVNQYMYKNDDPQFGRQSNLRGDLLREVVFTPGLRPTVDRYVVEEYEGKRQLITAGYSPETPQELLDWVKERVAIPEGEWSLLQDAMRRDHDAMPEHVVEAIAGKLARVFPPGADAPVIVALERLPVVAAALYGPGEPPRAELLDDADPSGPALSEEFDPEEMLTALVGEWLQFYGPREDWVIAATLGVEKGRLELALGDLLDAEKVITGDLVTGGDGRYVCDAENFESLLRLSRARAAPSFEPVALELLPLLLASVQRLPERREDVDGVYEAVEQLSCYPARAEAWESDILPARVPAYMTPLLDSVMQEGQVRWVGSEGRRLAFAFEADLDLLSLETNGTDDAEIEDAEAEAKPDPVAELLPDMAGRYTFTTVQQTAKEKPSAIAAKLWDAAWAGDATNDTFLAVRRGIESKFEVADTAAASPTRRRPAGGRRAAMGRFRGSATHAGSWMRLPKPDMTADLIESEERKKDRARLLLDRYGVLFKQLLQREAPPFRWAALFRTLRLMELSGEVLGGCFFLGLPGLQFVSHQAFRTLQRRLPEDAVYWMNATDPASVCGLGIDGFRGKTPRREVGTHLVYRGTELVLVSQRSGKALTIAADPDDPLMTQYLAPLRHLLTRAFQPVSRLTVETINDEDAGKSPFVDALRTAFDAMVDYRAVVLYRRME